MKHIGKHSSLNGKVQPLTDDNFKDKLVYEQHKNPDADLNSSLRTYSTYTLEKCYKSENFYWAFNEKNNKTDFINFKFKQPFLLKQYVLVIVLNLFLSHLYYIQLKIDTILKREI